MQIENTMELKQSYINITKNFFVIFIYDCFSSMQSIKTMQIINIATPIWAAATPTNLLVPIRPYKDNYFTKNKNFKDEK